MVKQWKLVIIIFVVGLIIGAGFVMVTSMKPDSKANINEFNRYNTLKDEFDGYKSYVENSAYMNLDLNNIHMHYVYYDIIWKDAESEASLNESKNEKLSRIMSLYYSSDDFCKMIIDYNSEYNDKALNEVVRFTRSGSMYIFSIVYSDGYYVKDLCDVIDDSMFKKMLEWESNVGEFEFVHGPETDITIDGFISGYKDVQEQKLLMLDRLQTSLRSISESTKISDKTNKQSLGIRVLFIVFFAAIWTIVSGGIIVVFDKYLNTSKDVFELLGQEPICVLRNSSESIIDRLFYRNNDRYQHPELYLSILERKLLAEGANIVLLYNCTNADMSDISTKITEIMNEISVKYITNDNTEGLLFNVKDDMHTVIIVKCRNTKKSSLLKISKLMNEANVKCSGIVFVA